MNNMKKSGAKIVSKRAQLTLFIILGLIITSAVLVFFLYIKPTFFSSSTSLSVDVCVTDVINKAVAELSPTAGIINPKFSSLYMDENYTFVCYTSSYYQPCVVQVPFLTSEFEKSLNNKVTNQVEECYEKSVDQLRAKGYNVLAGNLKTEISIQPTYILARISSPTVISSQDSSQSFNNFDVKVNSGLYEVLAVSNSILQFETTYGDTDTSTYMVYYPNLGIDKIRREDGVRLYSIDDGKGINFKFAVRSYAWPPGYAI